MKIMFRGVPDPEVTDPSLEELKASGIYKDGFVYGYYQKTPEREWIIAIKKTKDSYTEYSITILPDTVGQYIGRADINKVDIYTGDVLQDKWGGTGIIKFHPSWCAFYYSSLTGRDEYGKIVPMIGSHSFYRNDEYKIIGNSRYNPELIRRGWITKIRSDKHEG